MVAPADDPAPDDVADALARLTSDVRPLEPFVRLDRSQLWSINADYWRTHGHAAFLRDSVPYHATSDGTLSDACTRFLAGWMQARPAARLTVIEAGPGSGLFARGVMRGWQAARATGPALPPLRMVLADVSTAMFDAMTAHSILAIDGVETVLEAVDLNRDPAALAALARREVAAGGAVLVVANYLLDSLPSRHFRLRDGAVQELAVQVAQADKGASADARGVIVRHRYEPADGEDPVVVLAQAALTGDARDVTINSHALTCITATLAALGDAGLMLFSDYAGGSGTGGSEAWQAFGGSVAAGLHFGSVDQHVTAHGAQCISAQGTPHLVTSRLAGNPDAATANLFRRLYALDDAAYAQGRIAAARAAHRADQHQEALAAYQAALAAQPGNWGLLLEVAGFTVTAMKRPADARTLLTHVLEANPISTPAMNLMGDCAYADGALDEAADWYLRAEAVAGGDARARLNLAYCTARQDRLAEALRWIAEALAADATKGLTAEILERQAEIIARIAPGQAPG